MDFQLIKELMDIVNALLQKKILPRDPLYFMINTTVITRLFFFTVKVYFSNGTQIIDFVLKMVTNIQKSFNRG